MTHLSVLCILVAMYWIVQVSTTQYKQQIVAIVGDDPVLDESAYYLSGKNAKLPNQVIKWFPNNPANPTQGGSWKNMEWDPATDRYVEDKVYPTIDPLPASKSRIQVIGHGERDATSGVTTLGGLEYDHLAQALSQVPRKAGSNTIERISLVGCNIGDWEELPSGQQQFMGDEYPSKLIETLHGTHTITTELSVRNGIVGVDSTGRKVYGEETPSGILWRTSEGQLRKTIVSLDSAGNADTEVLNHLSGDDYSPPVALKTGFKVGKNEIVTEDTSTKKHYTLKTEELFNLLTETTSDYFDNLPIKKRAPVNKRKVTMVDGTTKVLDVIEISSYEDLSLEVKHWGDTKFQFGPTEEYVHYRYGDWILQLKVQAIKGGSVYNMKPFYTDLVGVVTSENHLLAPNKNTAVDIPKIKTGRYNHIQRYTDEEFFPDAINFASGNHEAIGLHEASGYNAEAGLALFLCEPIRDWRAHVTNKLTMDLYHNMPVEDFSRQLFFENNPMGRGGAGPAKHSGLRDVYDGTEWDAAKIQKMKRLFGRVVQDWLAADFRDTKQGLQLYDSSTSTSTKGPKSNKQAHLVELQESLLKVMKAHPDTRSGLITPQESSTLPHVAGKLGSQEPWDAREVDEPEIESAQNEVNQFTESEVRSVSLRASQALLHDQLYISEEIHQDVSSRETRLGKDYEVDEETVKIENNRVTYEVYDKENPSERETMETEVDESKLSSKELMDEMHEQVTELQSEGGVGSKINKGLAIYGAVMGIKGTVDAFEKGEIAKGSISLSQTLHGIGELTGVNQKIYKAASKALGKIANRNVGQVSESIETAIGENAGELIAREGGEALSTIGKVGELFEDIPVVGTAFGLYNIYEDLQQHTVIGYVDAGLDTLITVLGLLGPEAEPFVIALSIVRLGIDTFYADIKKELDSLPPGASVGDKVVAVLKGIGEAIIDIADTITGGIFSAFGKIRDLELQYQENQDFLRQISNFHNYFHVTKCQGDHATINFADGASSWNGGDIVFTLHEGGRSGHLHMKTTDSAGREVPFDKTITFSATVTDIVMGIGESHSVQYQKKDVKVLWVIPVDERNIISGLPEDRTTLHGTYIGNSDNNVFTAIQKLPSGINFDIEDYHYSIQGGGGDDSFYLGPQRTDAQGGDGSDLYIFDEESTHASIYNFASDGSVDYLKFPQELDQLNIQKIHSDLYISSGTKFKVTVRNWFNGPKYQHAAFKIGSLDFLTYRIEYNEEAGTVAAVADTINYADSAEAINTFLLTEEYPTIVNIIGSDYSDNLWGNDQDNIIVTDADGPGDNILGGRGGADTFVIKRNRGEDLIDLGGPVGVLDTIVLQAFEAHEISVSNDGSDLRITAGDYRVDVMTWFVFDNDHAIIYSGDNIMMEIRTEGSSVSLHPTLLDITTTTPQPVDLTSSDIYQQISSVSGSDGDDHIIGNDKNNYLNGDKGNDRMKGGPGSDLYVVKKALEDGNLVGTGIDDIENVASDKVNDLLLFGENYNSISLSIEGNNLLVSSTTTSNMKARIVNWFEGENYQHLTVKSMDGVSFSLPTDRRSSAKTALMIDKSKSTEETPIDATQREFLTVKRIIGSPQSDDITGNDLDNYIDPREGGGTLRGNGGSDTYVLKKHYGDFILYNEAEDSVADSLLFQIPFTDIQVTNDGRSITLRDSTADDLSVRIVDYISNTKVQHLSVTSGDGYIFTLPPSNNYSPVVIVINKVGKDPSFPPFFHYNDFESDPTNLDFSHVRTFYGIKNYSNVCNGNSLDNTLIGGELNDNLAGRGGNDVLKGGGGINSFFGYEGNDTLIGGKDQDYMTASYGDDILVPGGGDNWVHGGYGDDTAIYAGEPVEQVGIDIDLNNEICIHGYGEDTVRSIENVYGTPYDDKMISASFADNVLKGKGGDDLLVAYDGYDILIGGEGADRYDLIDAQGTKVIDNEAKDNILDTIDLSATDAKNLRYDRSGDDLIIRHISTTMFKLNYLSPSTFDACSDNPPPASLRMYKLTPQTIRRFSGQITEVPAYYYDPETEPEDIDFCEVYDPRHPTVVIKNWYKGQAYQHIQIEAADCVIGTSYLSGLNIPYQCVLP